MRRQEKLIEDTFRVLVFQVTVELLPDSELAALVEQREKERLQSAKAGMSAAQIEAVIKETEELKLRQVG